MRLTMSSIGVASSAIAAVLSSVVFAQAPVPVKVSPTVTVAQTAPAPDSLAVTVVGIEDVRKTKKDGFPAGLKVTLGVSGVDIEKVKNVDCNLMAATDDSGKNLIKKEKGFFDETKFLPDENTDSFEVEISLKNPSRKAASIKLEGTLDMFVPSDDPAATIKIANAKKTAGTPVKSEALLAAKASVTLAVPKKENEPASGTDTKTKASKVEGDDDDGPLEAAVAEGLKQAFSSMFSMDGGPNSITLEIVDPEGKIKEIEFFSSTGKEIEPNGSSSMGNASEKLIKTLDFDAPLPETAEMRIYVATPKAEKQIPFNLTNVALP